MVIRSTTQSIMYPQAHLLEVPQELRDQIYAAIVRNIQSERQVLDGNPISSYDGLRLCCRQLYTETLDAVFFFGFTSQQIPRLMALRPRKADFLNIRSVSIEIPFDLKQLYFQQLAAFLNCMQLSLQELHLFFVGQDKQGNQTGIYGCGKKQYRSTRERLPVLLDKGQDFGYQWEVIRQIAILRNLRVLEIENANVPLSQGILYNNKPFLKAVSMRSDPRSVPSSFSRMEQLQRRELYRNICIRPHRFPPVEVLNLDANSASNIEGIVNGVNESLRHFSWRVPNPDLQPYNNDYCFYDITNRLIQTLSTRAPRLEILRLCITMRDSQQVSTRPSWDLGSVTEELSHRLPLFQALKSLEVHFTGGRGFFRDQLIAHLPPSLSRLYISDSTISASELVAQVRKRYFTYIEDDGNDEYEIALPNSPIDSWSEDYGTESTQTHANAWSNYLGKCDMIGEHRHRRDDIPLSGGVLGFINFEYSDAEADKAADTTNTSEYGHESDLTKILRLNGQLLDREHNLHLVYTQAAGQTYGIPPRQEEQRIYHIEEELPETSVYSRHKSIYAAIYETNLAGPKELVVKQNRQALLECLGEDDDWYFGREHEAMGVFELEPVARVQDQKEKPMALEVEVPGSSRCRWVCPDLKLPPVGTFPVPAVPADWKDHI